MSYYEKMKKAELIRLLEKQEDKIASLENDLDYYCHECGEYEQELDKLRKIIVDEQGKPKKSILDIDNFNWRLHLDGLHSQELEDFISEYLRYYNVPPESEV